MKLLESLVSVWVFFFFFLPICSVECRSSRELSNTGSAEHHRPRCICFPKLLPLVRIMCIVIQITSENDLFFREPFILVGERERCRGINKASASHDVLIKTGIIPTAHFHFEIGLIVDEILNGWLAINADIYGFWMLLDILHGFTWQFFGV